MKKFLSKIKKSRFMFSSLFMKFSNIFSITIFSEVGGVKKQRNKINFMFSSHFFLTFLGEKSCALGAFPHFTPLYPTFPQFTPFYPTLPHFTPTLPHFTPLYPTFPHFSPLYPTLPHFTQLFPTFPHFSPLYPTLPRKNNVKPRVTTCSHL